MHAAYSNPNAASNRATHRHFARAQPILCKVKARCPATAAMARTQCSVMGIPGSPDSHMYVFKADTGALHLISSGSGLFSRWHQGVHMQPTSISSSHKLTPTRACSQPQGLLTQTQTYPHNMVHFTGMLHGLHRQACLLMYVWECVCACRERLKMVLGQQTTVLGQQTVDSAQIMGMCASALTCRPPSCTCRAVGSAAGACALAASSPLKAGLNLNCMGFLKT